MRGSRACKFNWKIMFSVCMPRSIRRRRKAQLVHEEYRLGDYHRSFILSDEVDRERITAELKNGVLRLFLPKAERARTRRIEIKS